MKINFKEWLKTVLNPNDSQFKEMKMEDIHSALNSPTIRKIWTDEITERIQQINMELDNLLSKEDRSRVWETLAIERRTLICSLRMVLDAQHKVESEIADQERQNRIYESYRGVATPLNLEERQSQ